MTTHVESFPRHVRLTQQQQYQQVFRNGRRFGDGLFTMIVAKSRGPARLGLAIAKKQLKKAVDRNRIKRLVRESFRHQQQNLHGHDIVVLCRTEVMKRSNRELFQSLDRLWQQIAESDQN